ncbi:uncharacterized protein EAE97_003047 [Botrytis byssoidea]|uniref:Uncharacterized protein n=1 Tax=Botrytis byssoidea TaxID=139641 RepID=A0A9P5IPP9_9HELO|nr:uncharacterized protein EAE97_003047 [Botrytis byssoidea]KAF7949538.1 hypothetical protein EAE97_003047 [Botrytis byssoidea]
MVTYGFTVAGDRAASLEASSTTARKPQATLAFDNRISNDLFCSAIKIQQHPTLTKPKTVVSAYGFTSPAVATSAAIEFLAMPGNTSDSMNITITTNLIVKPEQAGSYSDYAIGIGKSESIHLSGRRMQDSETVRELRDR